MAYIGNAKAPLIFAANVRDDIQPELDLNGQWKTQFLLSQEVPGGNENGIMVVARRVITDSLVSNTNAIKIEKIDDTSEPSGYRVYISTDDETLAAALNVVIPPNSFYDGDAIQITSLSHPATNNRLVKIIEKIYDGDTIQLRTDYTDLVAEENTNITLDRVYYAPWEILEPEKDYTIVDKKYSENPAEYNRVIQFEDAPKAYDLIYVLHRGEATYNFVPSAKSVGPDQLQENLRDFRCDRFVVSDVAGQTEFGLSRAAINSKSLLVTVDSQIKDGDDPDTGYLTGDWSLDSDLNGITFKSPVPQNSKVKILHLGFSTVSRRSNISLGQGQILERSIKTEHLDYGIVVTNRLANLAVTTAKLGDNSVTSSKLLLENAEFLRQKNSSGVAKNLLGLSSANELNIQNQDGNITISSQDKLEIRTGSSSLSALTVSTDNKLGINTTPQHMLHLGGAEPRIELTNTNTNADNHISATNSTGSLVISADENNEVTNTQVVVRIDGQDAAYFNSSSATNRLQVQGNVSASTVNATNVNTTTINNIPVNQVGTPTGTIVMFGGQAAPAGWLLCDGSAYNGSDALYANLHTVIGTTYGGTGGAAKNFRVPDMRKRYPVGQDLQSDPQVAPGVSDGLALASRSITHTHTGAAHTHSISHTHNIPGHIHELVYSSPTADRSTLEISTSSGSHTTYIDHTHPEMSTTGARSETAVGVGINLDHFHNMGHAHGASPHEMLGTEADSPKHSHSASTGPGGAADGAHSHTVQARRGTGVGGRIQNTNVGEDANERVVTVPGSGTNGEHSHTININNNTADHYHSFVIAASTTRSNMYGTAGTEDVYRNLTSYQQQFNTPGSANSGVRSSYTLNHLHRIPAFSLPTNTPAPNSTGLHTHETSHFSGSIGNSIVPKNVTTNVASNSTTITLSSISNIFVGSTVVINGSQRSVTGISGNTVTLNSGITGTLTANTTLNFAAPSGNTNLSTISQSTETSGPASYSAQTGTSVSPHLVVNFIIKL